MGVIVIKYLKIIKTVLVLVIVAACSCLFSKSVRGGQISWKDISVIRHACGGIDGIAYTNSYEALENSILTGCGAVEIDFRFSKDGKLICVHEWEDIGLEKKPKLKAFKKYKINGSYTTMTAEKALKRLAQTKIFLIIDTKEKDTAAVYREIDSILSSVNGGETYKKKLVPQIYSKEEYAVLKEIYAYKNWIFTLYKLKLKKADEYKDIAAFCKENKIKTVTIPKEDVTEKRVGYFTKKNIRVATHTVNDAEEWERLEAMGVKTFYTDFGRNATD